MRPAANRKKFLQPQKTFSDPEELTLKLRKNFKIVDRLKAYSKNKKIKVVAFKLTSHASENERKAAVEKLLKGDIADLVVHNDLQEIDPHHHGFTVYDSKTKIPCEGVERLTGELSSRLFSEVNL